MEFKSIDFLMINANFLFCNTKYDVYYEKFCCCLLKNAFVMEFKIYMINFLFYN